MTHHCTLCREDVPILVNRMLHDLPIRLCTPCATFVHGVDNFTDMMDVLIELYENAALDHGDPPGSGMSRTRRRPAWQPVAPKHYDCGHCGSSISADRWATRVYRHKAGRVAIIFCGPCDDAEVMLAHHADAIRAMWDTVDARYSLMFTPVCGVA